MSRKGDRRHGLPLRSTEWRDPKIRERFPAELYPLLDQIADALDQIEQRNGKDRRQKMKEQESP